MQQVEQIVAEAVAAPFAQVGLQIGEARRSLLGLDHDLAVEESRDDRQSFERLLEGGKLGRPIESAARLELGIARDRCAPAGDSRRT